MIDLIIFALIGINVGYVIRLAQEMWEERREDQEVPINL